MEYNPTMRKFVYSIIVIGAIIIACMLSFDLHHENAGVIGGADGPTEIVISD